MGDFDDGGVEVTSKLLELFNKGKDIQYVLECAVSLLKEQLGCEAAAIRLMDELGNIPYRAHAGFSEDFIDQESPLCIRHDKCACIYISKGEFDPSLPLYTASGSFRTNNLQSVTLLKEGAKTGIFRGECIRRNWESFALVPVRFASKYYGLIQVVDSRKDVLPDYKVRLVENVAGQMGLYIHLIKANEETERELSYLIRRIMHDLKTPLATISMYADLIIAEHGGAIGPEVSGYVGRMSHNTGYMAALVSSLSSFSDSLGLAELPKEDIPLEEFLLDVVRDVNAGGYRGMEIVIQEDMPIVRYPSVYLKRVFINLLTNAVKFSSLNTSPKVEVGCEEKDKFYQISVSDNGMGMKDGDVEKVFLPFYRTSGAKGIDGTGLGLPICRKIVECCGGEIWVYSTEGEGSTFYFTVPK